GPRRRPSGGRPRPGRRPPGPRRPSPTPRAGPRPPPTSWTASSASSRRPRRRPRSSNGRTSSCTTLGSPALTVLNTQPRGSLVLPAGPAHPSSTAMEVLLMPTTQIVTPYQVITNRILALLEQGTVPWRQPWDSVTGMPRNLFSQHAYRGINVWLLTARGVPSPFWATFHQVTAAGGRVRTGEHGVPVVFWKAYDGPADPETGAAEK